MGVNSENEKVKWRYLQRLRHRERLSESTVATVASAIHKYDEFSSGEDYRRISNQKAIDFREWLLSGKGNTRGLSLGTVHKTTQHIFKFFQWLSDQPGYKKRQIHESAGYVRLDKSQIREANASKYVKAPTLDHVRQLVKSINPIGEIAARDRAVIAFAFESGMRDLAIATLPLGCFDRELLVAEQDPSRGVKTKFSKFIYTKLFGFSAEHVKIITDWYDYLVKEKGFSGSDPFFPRTRLISAEGGFSFEANGIEPVFWKTASPIREIFEKRSAQAGIPYFIPHSFRHAATRLADRYCTTGEQHKAVSQNLGHERIETTIWTYGRLETDEAIRIISELRFEECSDNDLSDEEIEAFIAKLRRQKRRSQNR